MKHMRTIQVPAEEREVIDHVTCDLCGRPVADTVTKEGLKWKSEPIVALVHRWYHSDADAGDEHRLSFDICEPCFREKLIPWFQAHGAEPQEKKISW